jgi:hypothetical protein
MREQTVKFRAIGLKPNTRYYPFFDGQDVTRWISPDRPSVVGGANVFNKAIGLYQAGFNQPIVSDSHGAIQGVFLIPTSRPPLKYVTAAMTTRSVNGVNVKNGVSYTTVGAVTVSNVVWYPQILRDMTHIVHYNPATAPTTPQGVAANPNYTSTAVPPARQFNVGSNTLRFTSSINDSRLEQDLEAFAEETYTANGLVQTVQSTIMSTRVPKTTTRQRIENQSIKTSTTKVENWVGSAGDPVAQSFTVDAKTHPYISTGRKGNKFGVAHERALAETRRQRRRELGADALDGVGAEQRNDVVHAVRIRAGHRTEELCGGGDLHRLKLAIRRRLVVGLETG